MIIGLLRGLKEPMHKTRFTECLAYSAGVSFYCRELDRGKWASLVAQGKESACNAGDSGSIHGLGRFPGEGNGNSLHYSCLENSMDRLWDCKESDTTE